MKRAGVGDSFEPGPVGARDAVAAAVTELGDSAPTLLLLLRAQKGEDR